MSELEAPATPIPPGRDEADLDLLAAVGSPPTAPFHEARVAAAVHAELRRLGLTPQLDPWGNILVRLRRGNPPLSLAYVAHMDHPGFELMAPDEGGAPRAKVLGGLVAPLFAEPVPLWFYPAAGGARVAARTTGVKELGPREREVTLALDSGRVRAGDFGTLDLPDFELRDGWAHLRAVDDLAGCASILGALRRIVRDDVACDLWAVFTRAEEVGLVGATLLARSGTLPAETIVVSLETSKALPGAEMGGGPVVRVGDASSAFHPQADALLIAGRDHLKELGVPVQRQLMSGGSCEATTFNLHGYRATGISIPLTNYHNRTPEDRVAAEAIVADDYHGTIALLAALPSLALDGIPAAGARRLTEAADRHDARLRDSAAALAPRA